MEWKPKGKERVISIKDISLKTGVTIGIFQGSRGQKPDLDIVVKYLDPSKSKMIRTPAHIHWVIDLLLKKEHNKELTLEFIQYLRKIWDEKLALHSKEEQQNIERFLSSTKELERFSALDKHGEYSVEFITYIVELFVIEEKTSMAGAFMFKDMFDALIEEKDIFYLVSKATHNRH